MIVERHAQGDGLAVLKRLHEDRRPSIDKHRCVVQAGIGQDFPLRSFGDGHPRLLVKPDRKDAKVQCFRRVSPAQVRKAEGTVAEHSERGTTSADVEPFRVGPSDGSTIHDGLLVVAESEPPDLVSIRSAHFALGKPRHDGGNQEVGSRESLRTRDINQERDRHAGPFHVPADPIEPRGTRAGNRLEIVAIKVAIARDEQHAGRGPGSPAGRRDGVMIQGHTIKHVSRGNGHAA